MYPDDSIQAYVEKWWLIDKSKDIKRGRLIKAFVPHVDQTPLTLIPTGRTDPTDHHKANYTIEPLRIDKPSRTYKLPVAALPEFEGEVRTVYRAKKRPVLIISAGGPDIPKELTRGKPGWQTAPTILVAPYYGADKGGKRAGFREEFIERIRRCEYPHYIWDILPLPGNAGESILRLDHIQPIGRHYLSYEWTEHCLSNEAMIIVNEWLHWLLEYDLPTDSTLYYYRKELKNTITNSL
jgi:hypothetical protein